MNSQELDLMVAKKSAAACVEFFAGASDADRKAVAVRAMEWYETADAFRIVGSPLTRSLLQWSGDLPKRTQKAIDLTKQVDSGAINIPKCVRDAETLVVARLAVIATAGLTDVRRARLPALEHSFSIVRGRKPRWLDRWLDFACECEPEGAWELVRRVENDGIGVASRETGYWPAMAVSLGQLDAATLIDRLSADRELIDHHLWKMLDDADAVRTLSNPSSANEELRSRRTPEDEVDWRRLVERTKQWNQASYIWKSVLIELASSGQIAHDSLLAVVFEWIARLATDGESKPAIATPHATSPAVWFQSIHDELQLPAAEKAKYVQRYLGLLSTKDASTLSWCLSNLSELPREALAVDDLLANFPNIFSHKRKEPAEVALKLIEDLRKERIVEPKVAGLAVLAAFDHRSSDIHKRALATLRKSNAISVPEVAAGLSERLDRMSGLVRKEAGELVSGLVEAGEDVELPEPEIDCAALLSESARHEGVLAEAAGLAAAVAAFDGRADLPACLTLGSLDIPRLHPDKKIAAVEDLDDLIYLFLHVLEGAAGADDFERLLDGLSRLSDRRPPDFAERVSSLRKRVDERIGNVDQSFALKPFTGINPSLDLAGIGRAWIDGKVIQPGFVKPLLETIGISVTGPFDISNPLCFVSERLLGVARLVAARKALPLLAAPTHAGGWIDPLVLAGRLRQWRQASRKPDKADLIQAVLRLAPEHRDKALVELPAGSDEYLNALRFALGGDPQGAMSTAELWVAAYRCREPRGTSELLARRFSDLGPDAADRAVYVEALPQYAKRSDSIFGVTFDHTSRDLPVESRPAFKKRGNIRFFPTELFHDPHVTWDTTNLLGHICPLDRESYFFYQTRRTALYLESQGTYWQDPWEPLFDPDVPVFGMGAWLIALALSAKQPEVSRLGLDALIATIEDDRLDGTTFGAVMGKLFPTGKMTLSRWLNALKETARISPAHQQFVIRSLELCLCGLPPVAEKAPPVPMLELLYERCLAAGEHLSVPSARKYLQSVGGKGKAFKLAGLLLELPADASTRHRRQVAAQVLQSRLARIERWKTCLAARETVLTAN